MKMFNHLTYAEYLRTEHWQFVRQAAIWAARGRCMLCGSERDIEVHHRDYDCLGNETPDDLAVLCRKCHEAYSIGSVEDV